MDSVNPKPTEPTPGLGRVAIPDSRDAAFPMATALPAAVDLPRFRYHSTFWPPLDQGATSHCVAYSCVGMLLSSPVRRRFDSLQSPAEVYRRAQRLDEWPGEEPSYYGTSVRAGLKVLQEDGLISAYYHAQSMADVEAWVLTKHPVIVGVSWYQSFYSPDPKTGVIRIAPGSSVVGGHAFLVAGYSRERGLFTALNSWGSAFGLFGRFRIEGELMERLLFQEYGDCVGCTEVLP